MILHRVSSIQTSRPSRVVLFMSVISPDRTGLASYQRQPSLGNPSQEEHKRPSASEQRPARRCEGVVTLGRLRNEKRSPARMDQSATLIMSSAHAG
jgi:hypothetical protein